MHPTQTHQDYLTPSQPYQRAFRKREKPGGPLRRWLTSVSRRWQRRKMIAALEAMDSRLLKDLGIYRGDIPRLVDGLERRELRMAPLARTAREVETEYQAYRRAA